MSYPLLTEKPLLGANFLPPQKSARERAAERWFNREKSPSTTTSTSDKTVSGQYYDEETGCHYNWNRYYCPAMGRYLTSDPIGLAGGLNTYLYANANPVNYYDPNGEAAVNPITGATVGGAVGGPIGVAIGGIVGGLGLYYGLIEPTLNGLSEAVLTDPIPRGKGRYKCESRCHLKQVDNCINCPKFSGIGIGYGNNLPQAIKNAEKSSKATAPAGCQARHCNPHRCWKDGRPIKLR